MVAQCLGYLLLEAGERLFTQGSFHGLLGPVLAVGLVVQVAVATAVAFLLWSVGRTAERALARFAKGDSFVAEGYVRTFEVEREGAIVEREEFVAKKIGHDLARTNYDVDRSRRPGPTIEHPTPDALAARRPALVRDDRSGLGL